MKFFLKSPVYFVITVPDGTDRQQVSSIFHELLERNFRRLIKNIRLEDHDLEPFRKLYGDSIDIRLQTEIETLNRPSDQKKVI